MQPVRLLLISLGLNSVNQPGTFPPLGLLSVAGYLRERLDVTTYILDQRLTNASVPELVRQGAAFEPDVVGIGLMTPYAHMLPELTTGIRHALPDALIVIGGPHASAFGAAALNHTAADVAVPGEGEIAFEQVIEAWRAGSTFESIPGLVWRDASGDVMRNPGTLPMVDDLDSLPFVAYDLIDLPKYWKSISMALLPPNRYAAMLTSRGCPFRCTYCHSIFGKRVRSLSAERMVAEIEHLVRQYDIRAIEVVDDFFNHDPGRVIEMADLLRARGLKVRPRMPNGLRSDILTPDVVDALADMRTNYVALALESGSPRIQKRIKKNLNLDKFVRAVDMVARRRIFTMGFSMLGFPSETEEDLQATLDIMCKSSLHAGTFLTVVPFPGTELYDEVLATHPERLEGICYDDKDYTEMKVNLSEVSDEILYAYQRKGLRRFFLNPGRLLRLARDYPAPWFLPYFVPMYLLRLAKGIIR